MSGVVRPGSEISRERTARRVRRHHHLAPYAALVLRGGYVEAGDRGRFRAAAGDVLLHVGFEAHRNEFEARGADILNLALPRPPAGPFGRVADPDRIARLAERDWREAVECLEQDLQICRGSREDWPDLLAAELRGPAAGRLGDWAERNGLRPSSLSRGFRLAYGVSPQRYRAECRASRAAGFIRGGEGSLASIAAAAGFSDQPHMTRMIRAVFGCVPTELARRCDNCVQDGSEAAR